MNFVTKTVTTNFCTMNSFKYQVLKHAFLRFLYRDTNIYMSYCHQIEYNGLISLPEKPHFLVVTTAVTIGNAKTYRRALDFSGIDNLETELASTRELLPSKNQEGLLFFYRRLF
jgi:hypothetical protein